MKDRTQAARVLLDAGWTYEEIEAVLGPGQNPPIYLQPLMPAPTAPWPRPWWQEPWITTTCDSTLI